MLFTQARQRRIAQEEQQRLEDEQQQQQQLQEEEEGEEEEDAFDAEPLADMPAPVKKEGSKKRFTSVMYPSEAEMTK